MKIWYEDRGKSYFVTYGMSDEFVVEAPILGFFSSHGNILFSS